MIALIDYDAGNIKSVEKAFQSLGKEVVLTRDPDVLKRADHVVLPGVGSFGDAMENLNRYHLVPVIHEIVEKGTPFLGICLGLQILFERSEESPGVAGLGLLKGEILRIPDKEGLKIPHMGWNSIHLQNGGRLFKGILQESYVYFVHSYYLKAEEEEIVKATTEYSTHIHASVEKENLFLPVPPGKELRSWACHSEKFCGNWRGGLTDVYKTNYPMPGCKKRKSRKRR